MSKCVIFGAAEFDALATPIAKDDYLLAADGGLRHLQALGLQPNGILGDFDSLGYIPQGATVFPVEKDDTDSMLAARQGLKMGFREFILYGGLDGMRLDHALANYQMLLFLAKQGASGYLIGKDYIVTAIHDEKITFPSTCTGILSLFCMGADAKGVTLNGLQYPLKNAVLTSSHPLGISNHFIGETAELTVKNGTLLAMWDRRNGFPIRA